MTLRSRTRRVANALFLPLGIEIRRVPRRPDEGSETGLDRYYAPPSSCQIANLAFLYELFLGRREQGFFVEVGAYDGYSFSNTSCLADRGWSGLLVEPVPEFAARCRDRYAAREDVEVVEKALGATHESVGIHVAGALSTMSEDLLTEYRETAWARDLGSSAQEITVEQTTLDALLSEHGVDPMFDLLVVDVEGSERSVFEGFDIDRWQPKMMIVELVDTHPDLSSTRSSDAALAREIEDLGYRIVYKDAVNTVLVHGSVLRSTFGA